MNDASADVEKQGAFSRAVNSIRTRFSLLTALFLLAGLAVFYVGGRIVLVHLVRDAEQQIRSVGFDISRVAYQNADKVQKAVTSAVARSVDSDVRDFLALPTPRFSVAAEFSAEGVFAGGAVRGPDGGTAAVTAEMIAPYCETLRSWAHTTREHPAVGTTAGILRLGGVSHYVSMVRRGAGCVLLGMPFDSAVFTARVRESFAGMEVKVTNRKVDVSVTPVPSNVRPSPVRDGFGIAPMFSEALDFYSGGFWSLGDNPFEAVYAIRDIAGNAITVVRVAIPESFSSVTRAALGRLSFFIALGGILFVIPLFWLQSRILLNPLSRMTAEVAKIGRHNADTDCPRLEWKGKDEFALLAVSVNRMLETISRRSLAVAQTEARHQALIDCLPDALAIFDPVGRLVAFSKEAEGVPPLPGFSPGETPDAKVFGDDPVVEFLGTLGETFRTGKVGRLRLKVQRPAGVPRSVPTRHFELRVMRMDEYFALAVIRDTTEEVAEHKRRLAAEERANDSKKRESLTLMAAGIAHDMNNVLSIVLSAAEAGGTEPSGGSEKSLGTIRDAVRRGAAMMREIMAFAGEARIALVPMPPNVLLEDVKLLSERVVGRNVALSFSCGEDVPSVDADPNQFWKVIFNIVKNAGEAIGSRPGQISVSTSRCEMSSDLAQRFISEKPLQPGVGALFTIADNGPGISRGMLSRIFDPYATSKSFGHGLGLATVRTIVEAHGGGISVQSVEDQGTTFQIFLPESCQSAVAPAAPLRPGATEPMSGEVLIVDDEDAIRKTTSILLRALKLTPHAAKDGAEALAVIRRRARALKAVILDANLGGCDAARLVNAIRTSAPNVPVIVSTGSAEEHVRKQFASAHYDAFLAKPYTFAELRQAIDNAAASI